MAHRILITGAAGFAGTWLQRELSARAGTHPEEIEVFASGVGSGAAMPLDVTDTSQCMAAVKGCRPTAVIHLAGIAAPAEAGRDPARAFAVNATGTLNLALAVLDHAPQARFVFAGSADAYGEAFLEGDGAPVDEGAALRPTSFYGVTKASADLALARLAKDGLAAVRFRPFNHTGPGQSDAFVVPAFAGQLAAIKAGRQEPVVHVGNLQARRDFLDVRDVVRAYADAALSTSPAPLGKAINLSTGQPVSVESILGTLIELSGLDVEVRRDPARMRAAEIPVVSGTAAAAAALLGWKPRIPLRSTLADVLREELDRAGRLPA